MELTIKGVNRKKFQRNKAWKEVKEKKVNRSTCILSGVEGDKGDMEKKLKRYG